MIPPPPRSTLFPYTTLFRSWRFWVSPTRERRGFAPRDSPHCPYRAVCRDARAFGLTLSVGCPYRQRDRKSTRLNSSHVSISYAVFCLKKKNKISIDAQQHKS